MRQPFMQHRPGSWLPSGFRPPFDLLERWQLHPCRVKQLVHGWVHSISNKERFEVARWHLEELEPWTGHKEKRPFPPNLIAWRWRDLD